MKLPPQTTENQKKTSVETMTQMLNLLAEKIDIIDQKSEVIAEQKKRIELLESYLRLANQKRFGASSEQTPPGQGELFNEAEDNSAEPEQDELPLEPVAQSHGQRQPDDLHYYFKICRWPAALPA